MLAPELYKHYSSVDPEPRFATDAEIAMAERLRRQLEERYLARPTPSSPSREDGDR